MAADLAERGAPARGVGVERWAISADSVLLPTGELEQLDVVIEGDRIVSVVPRGQHALPAGRVLDARGSTLLPGLIDSHVHFSFSGDDGVVENLLREPTRAQVARAAGNAQRALAAGTTTAVDCGGRTEVVTTLRDSIAAGVIVGPRLLVSGAPLTTTAGHCHWLGGTADSDADLIRGARELAVAGVDLIKVMVTGGNITQGSNPAMLQYSRQAVAALAHECRRLGKPLVAHVHTAEGLELAAAVGARVVAHATCVVADERIELTPSMLTALRAAGCFVDPTLTVGRPVDGGTAGRRTQQRAAMLPILAAMHEAGVPLTAGTDSGVPGVAHGQAATVVLALHDEVGLPIGAALLAATRRPAEAFGIDRQVGSIDEGLLADLVLVDGLVEHDPVAVSRPTAVWKGGVLVANDELVRFGPSRQVTR